MSVRSKLKEQIKFVRTIEGRKLTSVRKYTDKAYAPINNALIYGNAPTKACQNIIDDLDGLFKSVPATKQDIVVYRGVTKKHDIGILAGFISTTYDYETALSFADDKNQCCIFIITIPAGTKVLPVEDISSNPTEGEVLLPRSGRFVATKTVFRNGMECFYLDLVNEITSETRKSPQKSADTSEEQILRLIVDSISQEEVELLGLEDTISSVISEIEKKTGKKIKETIRRDAISKLKEIY